MKKIKSIVSASLVLALSNLAHSEVLISAVDLKLEGINCNERVKSVDSINAELRLPNISDTKIPAVIIMHSNAGVIGVGRFYADALNSNGIATLEIDSYTVRGVKSGSDRVAPTACDRLNDSWSALKYLSENPRINSQKIGILGLSSGALVAILSGQGVLARGMSLPIAIERSRSGINFKSVMALYPSCVNILYDPKMDWFRGTTSPRLKRSSLPPMVLVVGTKDDYEENVEKDCKKVSDDYINAGGSSKLVILEGATHAFEWINPPPTSFAPFAKAGKGSNLTMTYSRTDAEKSKNLAIELFTSTLK